MRMTGYRGIASCEASTAVTGLTHRQSYKDVFAITIIKTLAVFVVIGTYYATGLI